MKGVSLLAGALALLFSGQAWSSGDDVCGFSDAECGIAALPYLEPNNDTRVNLILLQSSRHHLALPLPQPLPDQTRTRVNPFTAYRVMGLTASETSEDDTTADSATQPSPLTAKAKQLGLPSEVQAQMDTLAPEENEGRHISNDVSAVEAFFDVLLADTQLTAPQRIQLAQARINMLSSATTLDTMTRDLATLSADGHVGELKQYLINAVAFYQGLFEQANSGFQSLTTANQPWVAETARYMLIRVSLNQAMENALDEYNMFNVDKSDKEQGRRAVERIDAYLQAYPKGRYADSARGLYRRAYWVIGDENALSARYQRVIAAQKDLDALQTINNEIDNKLLESGSFIQTPDAPLLMLVQDLKRLRSDKGWMQWPALSEAELIAQQAMFDEAGMQQQYRYLLAAFHYYQQRDAVTTLALIPEQTGNDLTDTTDFSLQVLRGLALEAEHGWQAAETHWRHLLTLITNETQQQYLQLSLAETLVKAGHPEAIFAPDSPVKNLRFRSAVLKSAANADLLRQQTGEQQTHEERAVALHTLLTQSLVHRDYAAYLKDSELLRTIAPLKSVENASWNREDLTAFTWDGSDTEEGYQCPALTTVVSTLNKRPNDAHATNCLGEFFFRTGNEVGFDWGESNQLEALTNAPSQFNGKAYSRLDAYLKVIADPQAPPEDKSYALYRAIYCYAPSGMNDCGTQEISKATRKAWFTQLKTEFKGSQWATQLKYYW